MLKLNKKVSNVLHCLKVLTVGMVIMLTNKNCDKLLPDFYISKVLILSPHNILTFESILALPAISLLKTELCT